MQESKLSVSFEDPSSKPVAHREFFSRVYTGECLILCGGGVGVEKAAE